MGPTLERAGYGWDGTGASGDFEVGLEMLCTKIKTKEKPPAFIARASPELVFLVPSLKPPKQRLLTRVQSSFFTFLLTLPLHSLWSVGGGK